MSFKVQPWEGAVTAARIEAQHRATVPSLQAKRDRPKIVLTSRAKPA